MGVATSKHQNPTSCLTHSDDSLQVNKCKTPVMYYSVTFYIVFLFIFTSVIRCNTEYNSEGSLTRHRLACYPNGPLSKQSIVAFLKRKESQCPSAKYSLLGHHSGWSVAGLKASTRAPKKQTEPRDPSTPHQVSTYLKPDGAFGLTLTLTFPFLTLDFLVPNSPGSGWDMVWENPKPWLWLWLWLCWLSKPKL